MVDPRTHLDVFTGAGRSEADHQTLLMWNETGVQANRPAPVPLDTLQYRSVASTPIFGPEIGLARGMWVARHRHVLVVKVATDGSSLARDWLPGEDDYRLLLANRGLGGKVGPVRRVGSRRVSAVLVPRGDRRDECRLGGELLDESEVAARECPAAPRARRQQADRDHPDGPVGLHQVRLCGSPSCSNEWAWNAEVMRAQASPVGPHTFLAKTSALPRYGSSSI